MASRSRLYTVRYGGWLAGTSNGVPKLEPAYTGIHSCIDEVHPGPPYRTGGPLLVNKKLVDIGRTSSFKSFYNTVPVSNWTGHLCAVAYTPPVEPTPLNLSGWGSRGWNRAFPVHPIYNLGVSLAEVRDIPRMISQTWRFFAGIRNLSFSRVPKSVGAFLASTRSGTSQAAGDYLNMQFGWAPFLQDLAFILAMQEKLANKLRWLKRHNNKTVRRNFEMDANGFSEDIPRNIPPSTSMTPTLSTYNYSGNMTSSVALPVLKTYKRRIWFASKWRFHIPELDKPGNSLTKLKFDLVGLALDPSIVYKATPWTWLLDWFFNVGTILQNIYLRGKYQTVAVYAYVMCSETFTYKAPGYCTVNTGTYGYMLNPPRFDWSGKPIRVAAVTTVRYEFRQREEANPYGFGITFSSLSAYQWSILAALGLTSGGRSLATRT